MLLRGGIIKTVRVMMAIGGTCLWATCLSPLPVAQAAEPDMKVEVTMKNGGYEVKGHSSPGSLTAIVLHNQDSTGTRFSSDLFKHVAVRKEGDVVEVMGHGVKSYHLPQPGKTGTLYFTKGHSEGRETQQYPFWCHMHPHMKGEFLVVETAGEVGGG